MDHASMLRGFQKNGSLRPLSILTGNGGLFLDFEMGRGADGAMTGYAFPEMLADVVRLQGEDRRDEAHDLFDAHLLLLLRYKQKQGVGLATRKYVLMRRGFIAPMRTQAGRVAVGDSAGGNRLSADASGRSDARAEL